VHQEDTLFLMNNFRQTILVVCFAVLPASAGPISWVFSGTGAGGGISFTDGSSLTGSFVYDTDVNCTESSCSPQNNVADFGLFTSLSVSVIGNSGTPSQVVGKSSGSSSSITGGSIIPTGVTWYINTNSVDTIDPGGDCCADSLDIWLVDANPSLAANADLTDVGGLAGPGQNPAFELQLDLEAPMTDAGGTIQIAGGSYAGVCATPGCGEIFLAGSTTTKSNQEIIDPPITLANSQGPDGPVPEPGSLLLLGSGLLTGAGILRRKVTRPRRGATVAACHQATPFPIVSSIHP
jgi:hypothetical protein